MVIASAYIHLPQPICYLPQQLVDGIAEQLDENNLGCINKLADTMVEGMEADGLPQLKETVQQSYQQVKPASYFSASYLSSLALL
jgi:hypothetical protein